MRFLKVFVFLFLLFFTFNSFALTNSQKNYLMQEKGYTGEQIQAYEDKVAANVAARKAGQEITPLSDTEQQMVNYAKTSEAIQYGNEAGLWEKFQASVAETTGLADSDTSKITNALDHPWDTLVDLVVGNQETSFPTILNAFTKIENGCWFCGIFETLFTTINALADETNDSLKDMIVGDGFNPLESLMGILLFGYIIFTVGKAFLSFEPTEPMKLFSDVFFPSMRCMIAALLIYNIQAIYTYMLDPLLTASIGFGQNVMEAGVQNYGKSFSGGANLKSGAYSSSKCSSMYTLNNSLLVDLTGGPEAQVDFSNNVKKSYNGGYSKFYEYAPSNPGMHKNVNQAIQCFLDTASQNLITWMAVGASFIADCWKIALKNFFGSIQMFIIGLIIFIGSFLIFLAFPLKLLDSMFRLMFITALMPLWIAFWVIPQTRKFTKNAWGMLEHVLITFIVLSVILVMVLTIIEQMFDKDVSGIDIDTISKALLADKSVKGLEYINFTGVGIFMTAALMYLAFSLIGKTDSFVNHFASGGGDVGMGKEMAGHATKGAALLGAAGWAGTKAAGRLTKKAVPAAVNTVGAAASAVRSYGASVANAFRQGEAEGELNPNKNSFAYKAGQKLGGGSGKTGEKETSMPGETTPPPKGTGGNPMPGETTPPASKNDKYTFADPDSEGAEASGSAPAQPTNQGGQNQNNSRSSADNRVFADPDSEGAEASGSAPAQSTGQNQSNQNATTSHTAADNVSFTDPDSEGADN